MESHLNLYYARVESISHPGSDNCQFCVNQLHQQSAIVSNVTSQVQIMTECFKSVLQSLSNNCNIS